MSAPNARREIDQSQPSTKPVKTKVAGLRTVFPSQKAMAAPGAARHSRSPVTTGAAQQVHIIIGREAMPPTTTVPSPDLPNADAIQRLGSSVCTADPTRRPKTIAFQIDLP